MKEEAINMESLLSQQGKLSARLKAPLMLRFFGDTVYAEFPKSLHCDFYDENGVIESRLDSKYGKYYENMGKVYLRDSVVVITTKGDTLRTPELWWDQNAKNFIPIRSLHIPALIIALQVLLALRLPRTFPLLPLNTR